MDVRAKAALHAYTPRVVRGMEAEIAKEVFGRSRGDTVHTLVAMILELWQPNFSQTL
jgi:hypothetical protein